MKGLSNIRLIPLDKDGKPMGDAISVPVSTFDFTTPDEPGDDTPLITGVSEWTMELKDIDIAGILKYFIPEAQTDDRVTLEYGGHTIKGHLEYVGVEIVDGKEKQRYDMFDGVFMCGPHDEEGNHIV